MINPDALILFILNAIILFYVVLCILVSKFAKRRSVSFWITFVISFFFTPILGLAFVFLVIASIKKKPLKDKKTRSKDILSNEDSA